MQALSFGFGTTTNLLSGLSPDWDPYTSDRHGLFLAPQPAVTSSPITLGPTTSAKWGLPEISLHQTAEGLLSTLFPYRVIAADAELNAPRIPAGPLLIGDKDGASAVQALSSVLGLPLGAPGRHYALVRVRRIHDTITAMNLQPIQPFTAQIQQLQSGLNQQGRYDPMRVKRDDAQAYLDMFGRYGTHFVSRVQTGDVLFQVFTYDKETFDAIKKHYDEGEFKGTGALDFSNYTTAAKTGKYGFVQDYGRLRASAKSFVWSAELV